MNYQHTPVMLEEVIEYLNPKEGGCFIDCTFGGGGYSLAISRLVGDRGRVIGIDADEMAIKNAKKITNKNKNISIIHENFKNLFELHKNNFYQDKQITKFDGCVFDLGLSQAQLKDRHRGLSFQLDAPLDMAFGKTSEEKDRTINIINLETEQGIKNILRDYGEERYAAWIARDIVLARKEKKITKTSELISIIEKAVPGYYKRKKIHFATKAFQALRIATNDEIKNLKEGLEAALEIIDSGARLALVSYHSLEDRIVKNFFKNKALDCICPSELPICTCDHSSELKIITRKAIKPKKEEVETNPSARSAKLRVAQKI